MAAGHHNPVQPPSPPGKPRRHLHRGRGRSDRGRVEGGEQDREQDEVSVVGHLDLPILAVPEVFALVAKKLAGQLERLPPRRLEIGKRDAIPVRKVRTVMDVEVIDRHPDSPWRKPLSPSRRGLCCPDDPVKTP